MSLMVFVIGPGLRCYDCGQRQMVPLWRGYNAQISITSDIITTSTALCPIPRNMLESSREFKNHFMRFGGFHQVIGYLTSVGKVWESAGTCYPILTSMPKDMILQGKDFHRGIRTFILAYESLRRLRFEGFLQWSTDHNQFIPLKWWNSFLQ